jgi:predicted TIM-barrel fold metal-dependent hydrolase
MILNHVGGYRRGRIAAVARGHAGWMKDIGELPMPERERQAWRHRHDIVRLRLPRTRHAASSEELAAHAPIRRAMIEAFGPGRCMFESNFRGQESGGYAELWNAFKRITAGASEADKKALR